MAEPLVDVSTVKDLAELMDNEACLVALARILKTIDDTEGVLSAFNSFPGSSI